MGMSASQARLLTITSRLHDVELKAQFIQAQKIALATEKDDAYETLCNAQNAKAYKINIGSATDKTFVDANFNTLCSYYEGKTKDYILVNNKDDKIFVTQETADKYRQYGNDKYSFAFAMMGVLPKETETKNLGKYVLDEEGNATNKLNIMTEDETKIYNQLVESGNTSLPGKYSEIINAEDETKRKSAYNAFRKELMNLASDKIFEEIANETDIPANWNNEEFLHYTRLWEAINDSGGMKVIDAEVAGGEDGTKWFREAVKSGEISIRGYGENGHKNQWSETSFATSTNANFLQETEDKTLLKKAEIAYEKELNDINIKDAHFDTELKKLETERTALTQEMDSIKTVEKDNIGRTFGIFS